MKTLLSAAVAAHVMWTVSTAGAQGTFPVTLQTATGVLAGTMVVPVTPGAHALALIIPGADADRNGNTEGLSGGPDLYRLLADSLAAHGIASLRYDKRGIGDSRAAMKAERDLRVETAADDAAAWVTQFRADRRFSHIVIVGHGEGSLIGMLATKRSRPDGFVSLAGAARRADHIIHDELVVQASPAVVARSDSALASLVRGDTVAQPPGELAAFFRPSVQPYLISWLHYSGATELRTITVPVLIVQGTHDVQVAPREADLLAAALPSARVARIAGMNHLLKMTPAAAAEQERFYTDPSVPLAAKLVTALATFIRSIPPR